MSTRDELIAATKALLWERGYESMSPRAVQERSGAGQGSFYHHFEGKLSLASEALREAGREMTGEFDRQTPPGKSALVRVLRYLRAPREAVKGCRMGRLANEQSIRLPEIRAPLAAYFSHLEREIAGMLKEAQERGELDPSLNPGAISCTLVAVVQGGYVLARIHGDPRRLKQAVEGAASLLTQWTHSASGKKSQPA